MSIYLNGVKVELLTSTYLFRGDANGLAAEEDRIGKGNLEFTLNKLLKGAGAGADPTLIDVPTGASPLVWISPPVAGGGSALNIYSYYACVEIDAALQYCAFSFPVPADFTGLTSAHIVYIGDLDNDVTIDWTVDTHFAAAGEAKDTNTDTATADGQDCKDALIYALDITAAFTGIAANDFCGVQFTIDAMAGTSPKCVVLGLLLIYAV